ncbi:citrate-Mg2+:H+ or citrate-Ca2+:H+ symporter, CitMHS family [Fictibacillus solisalsi]|uniref:Citrate-Mg2+:H+ or citrate-Ca2+:H+ symporter, CitMHS family n=1 Tax=Fictibacillus solisalsi TaxID=459525 RepID=A0A1G9Y7C8_9BACL|nr:citrate:proton symporter [Fictibacillus solisalsi]SDN04968.1 citrate-Mg2+:H+ or citrate-Ca2+:H+ symporter, CitMHS family [Fictibacillus solisalsi]
MAILGFLMIATFLYLVMTKKVSVLIAFALVPIVFGLIGGFRLEMGEMMLEGVQKVTPTGIMIGFSILYFGLMIDRGLFDPMIAKLIQLTKGDPLKIVMATAVITLIVALDGDGSATFMITITALLPIYKKLGMNPLILASTVALGAGVMNIIPWGGPLARAMVSLDASSSQLFNPIIIPMLSGMIWVVFVSYVLGKKERKRLGIVQWSGRSAAEETAASLEAPSAVLPKMFWFNFILTAVLVTVLIMDIMPVPVLFILAFALALIVNFPDVKKQNEQIATHAKSMVMVCFTIFAAGIFTGVLSGTKMLDSMAVSFVSLIPEWMGPHLPALIAVISMPLSLVFSPDAFYYGVLPIVSKSAASFGIDPLEIGRAALLGNATTGFPLSPMNPSIFVLLGLCKVELGDLQKSIFLWAFGTTIVMTVVALLTGAISL